MLKLCRTSCWKPHCRRSPTQESHTLQTPLVSRAEEHSADLALKLVHGARGQVHGVHVAVVVQQLLQHLAQRLRHA